MSKYKLRIVLVAREATVEVADGATALDVRVIDKGSAAVAWLEPVK